MKKVLFIAVAILMTLTATVFGAYGFFGMSQTNSRLGINIGAWKASTGDLMEYLNNSDTYVPLTDEDDVRFLEEIADLFWDNKEYDDQGNLTEGTLNERYQGYTVEQVKDIMDTAISYVKDYLEVDESGNVYYPANASGVEAQPLSYDTPLAAGQSVQIPSAILTADLETSTNNSWEPMTYYISMEAPNGEDISDYALEVLYSPPFEMTDAFSYAFRFTDPSAYNGYGWGKSISRDSIVFHPVTGQSYTTEVMRKNSNNAYVKTYYEHTLAVPPAKEYINENGEVVTSRWSRFEGLNMTITAPKGSTSGQQQLFENISSNPNRQGMILMGKPNGSATELRLSIFSRNVAYGPIGILPLLLNVSRGVELDQNQDPVNYGEESQVFPIIKVRATRGYGL